MYADDFRYAGDVASFQRFARGEAFAFQNGAPVMVKEDSILLLPMKETRVHEEVCCSVAVRQVRRQKRAPADAKKRPREAACRSDSVGGRYRA